MTNSNDFKVGVTIEVDGNIYTILEFQHPKPGKGAAFVRAKIRNVIAGSVIERTFNPNEKYPTALTEGTILAGRYVVGRVLGKGGFGVTYLCYDSKDKTRVAIKEYLPDSLTHRNTGETQVSTYGGESEEYLKTGAQKFYDEAKLVDSEKEIAVQVGGKLKSTIIVPVDADNDSILAIAYANEFMACLTEKAVTTQVVTAFLCLRVTKRSRIEVRVSKSILLSFCLD